MGSLHQFLSRLNEAEQGRRIFAFAQEAYPLCRSITGNGVRRTLEILQRQIPLKIHEVASGTQVFDWQVPREWNLHEAWIEDPSGRKIVDVKNHSLHVLNYSVPVDRHISLAELKPHLYSLPDQPDLIPYRTSYFKENWGFCLPHRQLERLVEGTYRVKIHSTLEPGHLTYGEFFLAGASDQCVHFSAHICHPSLANDNLSGIGVVAALGQCLRELTKNPGGLRYSYRFLFAPGTIGAITWLAHNEQEARHIHHGLVAANLGDGGPFHYKRSRQGTATIDRAALQVLQDSQEEFTNEDFVPFGYDERQYCSPGFDLPIGCLSRTPWGHYPEYHTSADNLDFIRPEHLGHSLRHYLEIVHLLESNRRYRNLNPRCEPQLGRRGLYNHIGGREDGRERELALLWVLNLSDGTHDLLDICERAGLSFAAVLEAVHALLDAELLAEIEL